MARLTTYNYLVPADGKTSTVIKEYVLSSVPVVEDWQSLSQQQGVFYPQAAFVDNTQGIEPCVLNISGISGDFIMPAGFQGWLNFVSIPTRTYGITGNGPVTIMWVDFPAPFVSVYDANGNSEGGAVSLTQNGSGVSDTNPLPVSDQKLSPLISAVGTLTADAANVQTSLFVGSELVSATNALPVTQSVKTGALTDGSGTITTASTSQQVFAANSVRAYLLIQNISADDLYINFTGAASASSGSIKISPDGAFAFEDNFVSTEAVNIFGATAGQAFTAKEG